MLVSEIAARLEARVVPPAGAEVADDEIYGVAGIEEAGRGQITFLGQSTYRRFLPRCRASALLTGTPLDECPVTQLVVPDPYVAYARVSGYFYEPVQGNGLISPKAEVAADATIGEGVSIYPFCYVGAGAAIGDGSILMPGAYVGEQAIVGKNTVLHPQVVVGERCVVGDRVIIHAGTVLGADGFGYAVGDEEIVKVPQTGIVRIGNDVEIGACASVDRAAMGETLVNDGCKLDSQVHIGHNVVVGRHCMFAANTSLAGSATLGDWVITGGLSGVAGHLKVGDRVRIGAMTGVIRDADAEETYLGFPAEPAGNWRRRQVYFKRLGEYEKRIRQLEERLDKLAGKED